MEKLFRAINRKELSPEEAVTQMSAFMDEVEKAIRETPKTVVDMSIVEASPMLQQLLYSFYTLHKRKEKGE